MSYLDQPENTEQNQEWEGNWEKDNYIKCNYEFSLEKFTPIFALLMNVSN